MDQPWKVKIDLRICFAQKCFPGILKHLGKPNPTSETYSNGFRVTSRNKTAWSFINFPGITPHNWRSWFFLVLAICHLPPFPIPTDASSRKISWDGENIRFFFLKNNFSSIPQPGVTGWCFQLTLNFWILKSLVSSWCWLMPFPRVPFWKGFFFFFGGKEKKKSNSPPTNHGITIPTIQEKIDLKVLPTIQGDEYYHICTGEQKDSCGAHATFILNMSLQIGDL